MAINAYVLYNLFSNFGNITKIMFLRNKRSALIEFENMEFATHAKDFLNGQTYLGEQVRIFYSNYQNINLSDNLGGGGMLSMAGGPIVNMVTSNNGSISASLNINSMNTVNNGIMGGSYCGMRNDLNLGVGAQQVSEDVFFGDQETHRF